MNKIRLLVDAHIFDGFHQGSRTFLKGLYNQLAEDDLFEIYIAANNYENIKNEFDCADKFKFIKLNTKSKILRLGIEIPYIIWKNKIDYAHFQYITPFIKNCNFILTIHDVLFLDFKKYFTWTYRQKKYLFYLSARYADILTTVSEYSKFSISRHFKIKQEKINIISEGVSCDYFFNSEKNDQAKKKIKKLYGVENILLYISRIEARKNHIFLLKAFLETRLWERGYHLVFIGDDSVFSINFDDFFLDTYIDAKSFFHHLKNIPYNDLISFYRSAEIAIYPSIAEGFGLPPLESGAVQTETILSNTTSLSEFTFFEGRFFSPDDKDSLKEKLLEVIEEKNNGKSMQEISGIIKEKYSWRRASDDFKRLILNDIAD